MVSTLVRPDHKCSELIIPHGGRCGVAILVCAVGIFQLMFGAGLTARRAINDGIERPNQELLTEYFRFGLEPALGLFLILVSTTGKRSVQKLGMLMWLAMNSTLLILRMLVYGVPNQAEWAYHFFRAPAKIFIVFVLTKIIEISLVARYYLEQNHEHCNDIRIMA